MPMNNDPWYTRTEFWASLATHLAGIFLAVKPGSAPVVRNIGTALGLLSPIVYAFGRSNVKAAQAAAAAQAVAQGLSAASAK